MGDLNRRETHRSSIGRIRDYSLSDELEESDAVRVNEQLKLIDKAFDKYLEAHLNVVDEVTPQEMPTQHAALARVETIMAETRGRLRRRLEQISQADIEEMDRQAREAMAQAAQNASQNHNIRANNFANQDVRLERLTLDNFDGNYARWREWRAMYDSLVHEVPQYNATQKIHYMRKALSGQAQQILSGWQTIGENYEAAYNTLVEVYENKYRIIMAHLEEWRLFPKLGSETHNNLRALIDTINRVTRQLKVAGSPVDHWDHILVFDIVNRMPPRTRTQWETMYDQKEMPTVTFVTEFLEKRARGQLNLHQSTVNEKDESEKQSHRPMSKNGKPPNRAQNNAQSGTSSELSCYHCKQPHAMFRCQKFAALPLHERKNRVRDLKLCINCFSPNHMSNSLSCGSGPCKRCNKGLKHNSLLCNTQERVATSAVLTKRQPLDMAPAIASSSTANQEFSNGTVTFQPASCNRISNTDFQ